MRPCLWFSEVLKERKGSWLAFVPLKVCTGPNLYQVVKSSGMGSSHFPVTLQFYSFRTSLWMGENRENQTVMAKRPLKRRNAFSSSFSRVLCICSYGTVQETGMEICRKLSYRESRDYLTSNPTRNFWCTSTLETILHVTLKLQYQFNQNFRSSGPFSSQNSTKMPF